MPATFVRSSQLFPGAPYAYAAAAPGTGVIFTAGACPLDEQGHVISPGDIAGQMRQAVSNLQVTLQESGATLSDVVKTTVYVCSARREDLVAAWNVVAAAFGDHDAPSTLLGVAALGYEGQLVEIEAVAFVDPASDGQNGV